jgi:Protein of unknown function (DUF3277).
MSMRSFFFTSCHMVVSSNGLTTEVSGQAPGNDVFEAEFAEDAFITGVGADGQPYVSGNTNNSGHITVKLNQMSPSNQIFLAMLKLQRGGAATFAPCSVSFADMNRQDIVTGLEGVITKAPKITRGVQANMQEWKFWVGNLSVILGNPDLPALAQAAATALGAI